MKKIDFGHFGIFLIKSSYLKALCEQSSVTCRPAPICNDNRKGYDKKTLDLTAGKEACHRIRGGAFWNDEYALTLDRTEETANFWL